LSGQDVAIASSSFVSEGPGFQQFMKAIIVVQQYCSLAIFNNGLISDHPALLELEVH
jgi:hypothetical protein